MKILIGCPVFKRDWILGDWFEAIESQTVPLSDIGFVFELGPNDDSTHELLWEWHSKHPEVWCFDAVIRMDEPHKTHPEGQRIWGRVDYYRMVSMRNSLLEKACAYDPDRYFSLDSDILLTSPHSMRQLIDLTDNPVAASPLCYMTPDDLRFPNVMSWYDYCGGRARRILNDYPIGKVFDADIIMAAVMMSKDVYQNVRYRWHKQGEDLGWAAEMGRQGYRMISASNIYAAHIMHRFMLDEYKFGNGDPRLNMLLANSNSEK